MLPVPPRPLLRSLLRQQWPRRRKLKKALADANKGHIQREEAITDRLNRISALAGGEYLSTLFIVCLLILLVVTYYPFLFLLAQKIGVSLAPLQPVDEDPLMAAVNLLELHWISVQEVLELARHVLTWIFVGLWPKKRLICPLMISRSLPQSSTPLKILSCR
jgi:hypothetical protein